MHNQQYYREMFDNLVVLPEWFDRQNRAAERVESGSARYGAIERETGVLWVYVGLIHLMESGCNFSNQILNGQKWKYMTTIHPRNLGPFDSWEDSANFALTRMGKNEVASWPVESILYHLESWNGWGYARRGKASPYLWNGSIHCIDVGKFVADGKYDPTAHSKQVGAGLVLKKLMEWRVWIPAGTNNDERQVAI